MLVWVEGEILRRHTHNAGEKGRRKRGSCEVGRTGGWMDLCSERLHRRSCRESVFGKRRGGEQEKKVVLIKILLKEDSSDELHSIPKTDEP